MTLDELLAECQRRGVTLRAHGERLGASPREALDEDLVAELQRQRAAVLDRLAHEEPEVQLGPPAPAPAEEVPVASPNLEPFIRMGLQLEARPGGSDVINQLLTAGQHDPRAEQRSATLAQTLPTIGQRSPLGLPVGARRRTR